MSEIIHKPCPYVDCESSDAFDYNSVKKVGHCKSCERAYPSKEAMFSWAKDKYPLKERNNMNNVVDYTPKNIEDSGTWKYEPLRGIKASTPSKKLWESCKEWLDSFDKIVLSVDNDDAGNAVADKMAKLFPNKIYRVPHDKYKDANDFLQGNAGQEFKSAWWNAKKYTPENILNTTDQFLSLYHDTPEHQYVPTGIRALDEKILGLMQGHFTVIKAQTGIGKTEVMRYLEYTFLKQGIPIAAWHLEETKLRTLLGLVSYELKDNVTRRDLIDEKKLEDKVVDAIEAITKDELFYQFYLGDGQGAEELQVGQSLLKRSYFQIFLYVYLS